jgi:hypothetical protein
MDVLSHRRRRRRRRRKSNEECEMKRKMKKDSFEDGLKVKPR